MSLDFNHIFGYKTQRSDGIGIKMATNSDFYKDIDNYRELLKDDPDIVPMASENHLICECFCVSLSEINELCRNNGFDLEMIREQLNLGNGCGQCLKNLSTWKKLIDSAKE